MRYKKSIKLFILTFVLLVTLSSCTDKNAKRDESNKFMFENYSEFVVPIDELNELSLSNYHNSFTLSEEEQSAVDKYKNEVIRIAIPIDKCFLYEADGEYVGINYYTALQLEKDLGLTFEYSFYEVGDIKDNKDNYDIVTGKNRSAFLTLYDAPNINFEGTLSDPYYSMEYAAFSKNVSMGDIDLINVLSANTALYLPFTEDELVKNNNLVSEIYPELSHSYSLDEIIGNDYEFLVLPENSTAPSHGYKRIPFRYYSYEITSYFITNNEKFDKDFISAINKTITDAKEKDLTVYREKLELIKCSNGLFFTEEEKEFLANSEPIKTKFIPTSYPHSFYDNNYDVYNGKLIALLNRVSSITKLEFVDVAKEKPTMSEILSNLYNHDIDLGVGVEASHDRTFFLNFSDNYFKDTNIYIGYNDSIKENSDIYDYKIGTITNSSMDMYLTSSFPSKDIYRYNTLDEAYKALTNNRIDFLGTSKSTYYYLVNSNRDYDLKDVYDTVIPADSMFATPNTYEGKLLISIIDKVANCVELDQIKNTNYPLAEIDTVGSYRSIMFLRGLIIISFISLLIGIYFIVQLKNTNTQTQNIRELNNILSSAFKISNFGVLTNKLGSDFLTLDSAVVHLLGLDEEDLFIQNGETCIFFDTLVNDYLIETDTDSSLLTITQAINSVVDSNKQEYHLQIALKYAKNPDEVKYYETVITAKGSEQGNILIILRDATKEALYEKYEKAVINNDSLTEAKNRLSAYKLELGSHIGHTVAYINLDNFNQVNNTYGHRKGDSTLSEIVFKLLRYKHTIDVYRMNGDEFFAIFNNFSHEIADEILELFRETIVFNNYELNLSASIGFLTISEIESITHDEVINICNFAMLQSKLDGKNRYTIVDGKMLEEYRQTNMLDSLLKRAIVSGDIIPYFQPYINIYTKKVVGYETLMRWRTDEGVLAPFLFLSIAIKSGDIFDIDLLMFKCSAIFLKKLQDEGLADDNFVASSNFTPITLVQVDPIELVKIVTEIGIDPKNMTIEITEQLFASDKAFEHISMLKEYGFRIALDDFSVGHSSMAYLKKLSVDVLKLDKSLLDNTDDVTTLEIFKTVVNLGHSLNAKIIAEGVETVDEIAVLRNAKVSIGQGYHFARPAAEEMIYNFIKERNK